MSLQHLGTKHMTSTACWVAGEERSIVIVEKEPLQTMFQLSTSLRVKTRQLNTTQGAGGRGGGNPGDQKNKRYVVCVLADLGVLTSSSSVSIPALL